DCEYSSSQSLCRGYQTMEPTPGPLHRAVDCGHHGSKRQLILRRLRHFHRPIYTHDHSGYTIRPSSVVQSTIVSRPPARRCPCPRNLTCPSSSHCACPFHWEVAASRAE